MLDIGLENMVLQIDENMPALPTVVNFCTSERKPIAASACDDMLTTTLGYVQRRVALRDITNHV